MPDFLTKYQAHVIGTDAGDAHLEAREDKRVRSFEEVSACAALALPCGAIWARRARLELTMAISDIATTPLSRINVTRK
jgi:hypothetical protein